MVRGEGKGRCRYGVFLYLRYSFRLRVQDADIESSRLRLVWVLTNLMVGPSSDVVCINHSRDLFYQSGL